MIKIVTVTVTITSQTLLLSLQETLRLAGSLSKIIRMPMTRTILDHLLQSFKTFTQR